MKIPHSTRIPVFAHILVHNWRRHLAYALLAVYALGERGGFSPRRIIVSVSRCLLDSPECARLRSLGVLINPVSNGYVQKWTVINEVLEHTPEIQLLMQLDADCILTETLSLPDKLQAVMRPGANIMAHLGDENWLPHFQNRASLFLPAFDPRHEEGTKRLDAMMVGLTGLHFDSWVARMKTWLLGGLVLIRRSAIQGPGWQALQAFAWITRCDESALKFTLPMPRSGLFFSPLLRDVLPQNVNPAELDFNTEAPGFVHFAGDWYREHNAENRSTIDSNLRALFGIPLPSDAPVGPARPGDYDPTKDPAWKPRAASPSQA